MAEQVLFTRSLYAAEAVRAAADAYSKLASFDIDVLDADIQLTIRDPDEDIASILVDELCNYVLHETIVRKRGGS